ADDADEVTFLLGQAHEKAKKYAEAAKLYASYAARAKNLDHKIEALVRLAEVNVQLKDDKGTDAALKQAVKLGQQHGKTLEQGKFHEIVDPIAEQFTEKAIDAYEGGWKKAIELKIFNRWTADMRQALSRLNDVEYPPLREAGLDVRSIGPSALPDVVDAPVG